MGPPPLTSPRVLLALTALALAAVMDSRVAFPEFARAIGRVQARTGTHCLHRPTPVLSGRLGSWRTIAGFIDEHPGRPSPVSATRLCPIHSTWESRSSPTICNLSYACGNRRLRIVLAAGGECPILTVCLRASKRGSFFGKWMFCFWVGEMFQMFAGDILTFWRILPGVLLGAGASGAGSGRSLEDSC